MGAVYLSLKMVNHKNPDDLIIQIYPGLREVAVLSVLAQGSGRLVGAETLAWNQKREKAGPVIALCVAQ